ncbi:MAG TPA: M60 family metallopeptidase, partial [Myxococcota bacterium]|nr:M60 family metallopeptidase [Myxococcota bacterium]
RASDTVDDALATVPVDWPWWRRLAPLDAALGPVVPTAAHPVSPAADPLAALSVRIDHARAIGLPPAEVDANPAHADFPGAVPAQAPRVSRALTVHASYDGRDGRYVYSNADAPVWRGTGLYAPAGEVVRVTVPAGAASAGLAARVGVHTDALWDNDPWIRSPEITSRHPLTSPVTELASAFGGVIEIEVPAGAALGDIQVTVDGAVEMARYVRGQTTPQQWAAARLLDAPWAELEGARLVLNVPIATARAIADVEALVTFWDDVAAAEDELAAIPAPPRSERAVVDRQISGGWMHSGYPFMANLQTAAELTDLAGLTSAGSWGAFHELGHNHQLHDWILPGSTEASCNLWSVYVMEHLVGRPRALAHPDLAPAARQARISAYVQGGRSFARDWSVWTSLETYLQLQEAFGWGFYQALFADYADDAASPSTDQARIDLWVERTSAEAGVDLGPFYQAWGFPISPGTLATISALPPWTADPMNP